MTKRQASFFSMLLPARDRNCRMQCLYSFLMPGNLIHCMLKL